MDSDDDWCFLYKLSRMERQPCRVSSFGRATRSSESRTANVHCSQNKLHHASTRSHGDTDENPDTDADSHENADRDVDPDPYPDDHFDSDPHADQNAHENSDKNTHDDLDGDTDENPDTDANSYSDVHTDCHTDQNAHDDEHSDTDSIYWIHDQWFLFTENGSSAADCTFPDDSHRKHSHHYGFKPHELRGHPTRPKRHAQ